VAMLEEKEIGLTRRTRREGRLDESASPR
jgi:hypothetical protein